MEVETGSAMEIGTGDDADAGNEVANDPTRRHEQQQRPVRVPPSGGVAVKLSVGMAACRGRGRGPSEPSAGTRTAAPDTADGPEDRAKERAKEQEKLKGRKRKKHRRGQLNKKVWLWKKELAAAAEANRDGAGGGGGGGAASPSLRRQRSTAALPAPNNTTQFIMADHTDLQALDLDAQRGGRTTRARDSSFSIESDEEFSSSPEDEAYLSKEFSNTYEDVQVERLGTMSKLDLIQEYLQLEQRVDVLEKRLQSSQSTGAATGDPGGNNGGTGTDSDSETAEGETSMEPAMAEKIRIFQEEIKKLVVENGHLQKENQRLQSSSSLVRHSSSSLSSSVDSESDSSSSSGSSSSSTSGHSGVSRSSGRSRSATSSPICASKNKNADIEMEETAINTHADQTMETEIFCEDSIPKDSSAVSPVAAH